MNVTLVIFKPDGSRKDIRLKSGSYTVGRQDDATLRIPLPVVSRHHCQLVVSGEAVRVKDLGSSNGTFRNFERITEAELHAGDVLGLGDFLMTVQIDGEPDTVTPPQRPPASADSSMSDTPPRGAKTQEQPGADSPTQTKDSILPSLSEDSSIFDFDFDFEDEDRPRL